MRAEKDQPSRDEANVIAGGASRLDAALRWASTALPESERDAINRQLAEPKGWRDAVAGLVSRHAAVAAGSPLVVKNVEDFTNLTRLAGRGDAAAKQIIENLPLETIASLQ